MARSTPPNTLPAFRRVSAHACVDRTLLSDAFDVALGLGLARDPVFDREGQEFTRAASARLV